METKFYLVEDQVQDIFLDTRPMWRQLNDINSSSNSGRFTMTTVTIIPIMGPQWQRNHFFNLSCLSLSMADLSFQLVNSHDDHHH